MVTKAVSDQFGGGGIADQMIRFNGFPFIENEDHAYNVPGKLFSLSLRYSPLINILAPSLGRHAPGSRLPAVKGYALGRTR